MDKYKRNKYIKYSASAILGAASIYGTYKLGKKVFSSPRYIQLGPTHQVDLNEYRFLDQRIRRTLPKVGNVPKAEKPKTLLLTYNPPKKVHVPRRRIVDLRNKGKRRAKGSRRIRSK